MQCEEIRSPSGGKKPDAPCLFEDQNPRLLRLKKERKKKKYEVAWAKAAICMKYLQYRVVDEQLISFPTAIGTSVVASGDGSLLVSIISFYWFDAVAVAFFGPSRSCVFREVFFLCVRLVKSPLMVRSSSS